MLSIEHSVREVRAGGPGELPSDVPGSPEPILIRGLVAHWPVVQAALESPAGVEAYLRRFYSGATVNAVYGKPGEQGRIYYNEDLTGFNFEAVKSRLDTVKTTLHDGSYLVERKTSGANLPPQDSDKGISGGRSQPDADCA